MMTVSADVPETCCFQRLNMGSHSMHVINMEGQSGQKEHFLILINDLLILINDFLILINDLLILINGMIY